MPIDVFLEIDGIPGESTIEGKKDFIDVLSFSFGASQSGSVNQGGGAGAGKVSFQDFHFMKRLDKASPKLMLACASGQHIKEAIVTARKAGQAQGDYLKITFTDIIISSFQEEGDAAEDNGTTKVSFNFAKIVFEYTPQKEDGSADTPEVAGWDIRRNTRA